MPGKILRLIAFACSSLAMIRAAARAAQRLVRRGGHDVGDAARATDAPPPRPARRCAPCRPSSARRTSSAISRNFAKFNDARIRRRAAHDHLRLVLLRERRDLRRSRSARRSRVEAVVDDLEELAGEVHRRCRASGARPCSGPATASCRPASSARSTRPCSPGCPSAAARSRARRRRSSWRGRSRALDLVDLFAAAVVALARVPLGVLVRQHRPQRLHAPPG